VPFSPRYEEPRAWYNRKGYYAIVCQAVCDAQRKFLFVDAQFEGSTPDSIAFANSPLGIRMATKPIPRPFKLVGDAAYAAQAWMLTPYPGVSLPPLKDNYNYFQSSYRIEIECAFGLLCRRWGIFWRPTHQMRLARITRIIMTCCKLHNFCIDRRDVRGPDWIDAEGAVEAQRDFDPQDECENIDLSRTHRRNRMKESDAVRDGIADEIAQRGGTRPQLSGGRKRRLSEVTTCASIVDGSTDRSAD